MHHEEDFHFLRFESLQRLNIVSLEVEVARLKSHLRRVEAPSSIEDLETLRTKLQQYARRSARWLTLRRTIPNLPSLYLFFSSSLCRSLASDPWESYHSYFSDEPHHRHQHGPAAVDPL